MYTIYDEDIRNDAFLDAVYAAADDDPEPTHEDWQLATLDDLDEQTMLEEAA